MSASTANQQQAAPPSAITEALSLDLQVLTLLLRRNSAAHHRARYYRRLQMMIRSLERYGLHDANASFYEGLVSPIRTEVEWIQSMADRDRRKRARGVEDKWTTTASSTRKREGSQRDDGGVARSNDNDETSLLVSQTIGLSRKLTHHLPEVLSRILYAAEGLYTELSRGYFVPFCTVALAAISRIRALLMRMGREGCVDLGRILTVIDNVLEADGTNAIEGELWHDKLDLFRLKRLLKKIRQNNDLGKDTDWGDWTSKLMDNFVEIDPQEHEKEQQERRRQGTLRRGMSDMSTSSASKMLDKNTIAKTDGFDDDNEDNEYGEDSDINAQKEAPGEGANDLGESVDIGQNDDLLSAGGESTTKQQKKRKGMVSATNTLDANEQILQMMKEKSRPKSGIGGGGDNGSEDNPKKKKCKKEKLLQRPTTTASSIDDIFGGLGDDEQGSEIPEEARKDKKKSKKVKKVKKDKKKKSKRNAVNDIFDGL